MLDVTGGGMNKIYVPANRPEDWKPLLAKPDKHWRTGYSAKTLAYCWQEANGFPESVINCFNNSGLKLFRDIELLLVIPEHKVAFSAEESLPKMTYLFLSGVTTN
jgi:hypothetical protein